MTIPRRSALAIGVLAVASAVSACSAAVRPRRAASADAGPSATVAPASPSGPSSTASTSSTAGARSPAPVVAPGSSPAGHSGGPAVERASGPRTRPAVALTFHGAGDPAIARDLLAIFAAHRARVTVLAVGTWLAGNPAIAGEIVAAGHELGNHTYQHLDISSLSTDAARTEIQRCRDLLVAQIGTPGAHFRPSQTQHASARIRALAGAAGYPVCLSYDVDSLDFTDPGPDAIRSNVRAARAGSVVSMHFGHPGTVTAMPHVLDDLATRGLQAVTATTLLAP